jgi:ferritin-like metal-binding protein YciE
MSQSEQKLVQYLNEAHASEMGLIRVLQSQIAMAPSGSFRSGLESHLNETREHAQRIETRVREIGESSDPLQAVIGFAESTVTQVLALSKTPFDLIRGSGGEEKLLKNAKDACATEALEIATYTALERFARAVGDQATAELAASIRVEEEQMLQRLLREIPRLTDAVVRAEVKGKPSYKLSDTGAADALRDVANAGKRAVGEARDDVGDAGKRAAEEVRDDATDAGKRAADEVRGAVDEVRAQAKRSARNTRKVPGVAHAEGLARGIVASAGDLAIADYDKLTASEIIDKLPGLSQMELAKLQTYERRHQSRSTVLDKVMTLHRDEPWPGYDELTVEEIRKALDAGDEQQARGVRTYERAHKNRAGVLAAAERETSRA